jgi:1-deoxy-D-xylulose-5-phosphate synthase
MASTFDEALAAAAPRELLGDQREKLTQRLRHAILHRNDEGVGAALGAVEAAVAVHAAVADPAGSVFWDAGPHALAHELLSGLPAAASGRASDPPGRAISDAVGVAVARTIRRDASPVIAVIDGSGLSSGLAFEAVNHAGHLQIPLVLLLLDAQSGRGRGIGAVPRYLTRLRGHPRYADAKAVIEQGLSRMPAGEQAVEVVRRLKNSVRELLLPTEMWEELLGFVYLGPVDGHNLESLGEILGLALKVGRPVVVHVASERGRGIAPRAAEAPMAVARRQSPWLAAAAQAILAEATADDDFALVCGSAAARDALVRVAEAIPERFFDVTQGAAHATAFAASLAREGLRPLLVAGATQFATGLGPVAAGPSDASPPVTFALYPDATRLDAATNDIALARAVPGLDVVIPATMADLSTLLQRSTTTGRWTLIRLPRSAQIDPILPSLDADALRVRIGAKSIAIAAAGPVTSVAWRAAERSGVSALGVINLSLAPPLASIPGVDRWLLAIDAEFGAALAASWPRELDSITSKVDVPASAPLADQVEVIARAAASSD